MIVTPIFGKQCDNSISQKYYLRKETFSYSNLQNLEIMQGFVHKNSSSGAFFGIASGQENGNNISVVFLSTIYQRNIQWALGIPGSSLRKSGFASTDSKSILIVPYDLNS
mmetsp:Transcript_24800/g.22020  ORF Transcript_24800/g.22020 Transcript_24800/m.22020 type:complete len:110 (-) Transcript_24800:1843-2172(-)